MNVRQATLGLVAVAALISAFAQDALPAQDAFRKLKTEPLSSVAAAPNEEMVSRLIVRHHARRSDKLAATLQKIERAEEGKSANVSMTVLRPMSGNAYVVKLDHPVSLSAAQAVAAQLMRDSDVESAEPDRIVRVATTLTPTDPGYLPYQWHYFSPDSTNKGGANLPYAWYTWNATIGRAPVTVAVLDTGYRQHADLAPVLAGYDFITNAVTANDGDGRDADAQDPGDLCSTDPNPRSSWHGTHIAGTIAARMNNTIVGQGLHGTGIAPEAGILPVRVIGKCGGLTSDIVDGMRWAAGMHVNGVPDNMNPAQILNMSLGSSGTCSQAFQDAVNDVVGAGKVIVVAAGNSGSIALGQPANCTGVIAVTAHAIDGDNANYANIGAQTVISAPGGGCGTLASGCTPFTSTNGPGIYSLSNTGTDAPGVDSYKVMIGTSMAAAHVSGVVALMLSLNPALTPIQIKSYLQSSARPHPAGTTCTQSRYTGLCGAGLLDANGALNKTLDRAPAVSLANAYQVVAPNAAVTLAGSAVLAASPGTYVWTQVSGAPVGAISTTVNGNNAVAAFTAPVSGIYSFKLTVTDNAGKTGTATATVRVNAAPVLTAVADQNVMAGNAVNFTVGATDPEGGAVTFQQISPLAGTSFNLTTGAFSWPVATPAGSYVLNYSASDSDGATTTGSVKITVTAPPSSSGGGGSLDGESMIGLALLATCIRMRRTLKTLRK